MIPLSKKIPPQIIDFSKGNVETFETQLKEYFSFPWIVYTQFNPFEFGLKFFNDFIIQPRCPHSFQSSHSGSPHSGSPHSGSPQSPHSNEFDILEDCSACFGLKWNDYYIGTNSKNVCIFDLDTNSSSILTANGGSLVFLPNEELYEKAKSFRSSNDCNAIIGMQNLSICKKNLDKLKDNLYCYKKRISKFRPEIEINEFGTLRVSKKENFIEEMKKKGIECKEENQTIYIPTGWWLSRECIEHILTSIEEWYHKNKLTFRRLKYSDYDKGYLNLISKKCETSENFNEILSHIDYQLAEIIVGEVNNELVCSGRLQVDIHFESPIVRIEDIVIKKKKTEKKEEKEERNDIKMRLVKYLTQQAKFYSPSEILINCLDDDLIDICQKCNYKISGVLMKLT